VRINEWHTRNKIYEDGSATMRETVENAIANGVCLSNTDLRDADLSRVVFAGGDLSGVSFNNTILRL
jgi:uncharacterized protein YjbI with pentapeptide repeats